MSYAQLSRQLVKAGRGIPPLGLTRIESGSRRVDADDLVALAIALNVSPITLLMPAAADPDSDVQVTAERKTSAKRMWSWLNGGYPLEGSVLSFFNAALPHWERTALEDALIPRRDES